MAQFKTQDFFEASTLSVKDPQLQRALQRVGTGFDANRQSAIHEVTPEAWEAWRDQAQRIKAHTLDHLDYYLEMLHDNVTKSGGQVHFAADAAQANDIIADLARTRQVRVAIKSKSMVSEELELNPVLESLGVEVYETDLGEYIIQLAGEKPSHIIAPALHKTKEDVARLFTQKLGLPHLDDIEDLARAAREVLRDKFLEADLGISGANFVIAETGTLVIVTNEGNGRLCTSAPRVHIGITGIEKVIPSLQDLAVFLRLLPRSATGQRITSYVSLVSGPRRDDDEDGPEEFHLVLVDNGRSRLLADPELREALYCIRCGACLNTCPVYQKVGGHAYGWVYPGPIGAIVTPALLGLKQASDLPHASTLCGACRDACPVKINIPRMLLYLRHKLAESPDPEEKAVRALDGFLARGYARLMSGPKLLSFVHRIGRTLQKPLEWIPFIPFSKVNRMFKRVPIPLLSQWTRTRDLPALPPQTFHEIWRRELSQKDEGDN
jgi:L-lactate dehydrogenase complex protein LldF